MRIKCNNKCQDNYCYALCSLGLSLLATLVYLILCYCALSCHIFVLTRVLYTYLAQSRPRGSGKGVRKDAFKASETPA